MRISSELVRCALTTRGGRLDPDLMALARKALNELRPSAAINSVANRSHALGSKVSLFAEFRESGFLRKELILRATFDKVGRLCCFRSALLNPP